MLEFTHYYEGEDVAWNTVKGILFRPVQIIDALRRHASQSLENLDMLENKYEIPRRHRWETTVSMKMFTPLGSVSL